MPHVKVFAGGASSSLAWPPVTFSGTHMKRIVDYSNELYFEYLLFSSGTLTAARDLYCDAYLIGPGGNGSCCPSSSSLANASPGGGSGFPAYYEHVRVPEGNSAATCVLTSATTIALAQTLTAAKGGNASASSTSSTVGAGYTGDYLLYNDINYHKGTGGGATRGTDGATYVTPGNGGGGMLLGPHPKPGHGYKRSNSGTLWTWAPVEPTYGGYGAGAMGATSVATINSQQYADFSPKPALGIIMLRILV